MACSLAFHGYAVFLYSINGIMKNLTSLQPRYLHYSLRTEEVYVYWVRFLIRFHRLRRHAEIGAEEVEQRGRLWAAGSPINRPRQ